MDIIHKGFTGRSPKDLAKAGIRGAFYASLVYSATSVAALAGVLGDDHPTISVLSDMAQKQQTLQAGCTLTDSNMSDGDIVREYFGSLGGALNPDGCMDGFTRQM